MLVEQHTEHSSLCMQVVVAEGAPMYGGHQQARQLAQAGINTTAIADSAIFAMMARVNKVRTKPPALFHLHTVHLHLFSVVLVSLISMQVCQRWPALCSTMGLILIWGLATRCHSMRQYSKAVQEHVATAGDSPAGPSISDGQTDRQAGRQADRLVENNSCAELWCVC